MSEIVYPGARVTAQSGVRAQAVNRGSVRFWCQDEDPICGQEGFTSIHLGFRARPLVVVRVRVRPQAQAGVEAQTITLVRWTVSNWSQGSVCGCGSGLSRRLCFLLLGDIVWG